MTTLHQSARLSSTKPFITKAHAPATAARRVGRTRVLIRPLTAARVPSEAEVVVVGAGLAGLNAAVTLQRKGLKPIVLEASDAVGGRTRTDVVDGFLLDRGFQIFLTGYPEARATLDYNALQLKPFYAGARVWYNGSFHTVADPLRHFLDGILSLTNPIGSVADKINVGVFRLKSLIGPLDAIFQKPETTIYERLRAEGFSEAIIDRFFRPFLGGIFFNPNLTTSSRLFEFVMRMMATGENCLPAAGIGAMAEQLAAKLPADNILTDTKVQRVIAAKNGNPPQVQLTTGHTVSAPSGVIVAVEGPEAWRILGEAMDVAPSKSEMGVGTCNLYFKAPKAPSPDNVLYLNGTGRGLVNNCCFPSTVAPSYAPPGQTLVSVSTIGTSPDMSDQQLIATVKSELLQWFGAAEVDSWEHLRTYRIPFAQPNQNPPTNFKRAVALGGGLYVCGDHRDGATFDAALRSGRRAAEALAEQQKAAGSVSNSAAATATVTAR
eukprot:GHUV01002057.1.p1 GENE.GHUV01002057.1~~GHUV01002057.1.p1  ORF type:complete len:492 (+),score=106.65 GHUV01002057.1:377-1852(+)